MLKKKYVFFLIIALIIFLIDRLSKNYILNIAEVEGSVDIFVNSYLNIYLIWNTGIGFGLLSFDKSLIYNLITSLIIVINILIIYMIIKTNDIRSYFLVFVLGGSLGNLFDRLYYSAVPDFIDINYKEFHWFIFNVADIFITIGIICLIFAELMNYKKENEK
jgi:signal peptidase II|tara:strand:+ start:3507 stop:3992 length:486 start_codon:yes stop_codon:yes gene_type:complete